MISNPITDFIGRVKFIVIDSELLTRQSLFQLYFSHKQSKID